MFCLSRYRGAFVAPASRTVRACSCYWAAVLATADGAEQDRARADLAQYVRNKERSKTGAKNAALCSSSDADVLAELKRGYDEVRPSVWRLSPARRMLNY